MRRLFSNFAHGWPGIGLLIMRFAAGITVIVAGITALLLASSFESTILHVLAIAAAILLILGLWTPIAGWMLAAVQLCALFLQPADASTKILLAALGLGLALVGPGAFSMDARLFGWKRLNFRD